jgi:hypothetical protein
MTVRINGLWDLGYSYDQYLLAELDNQVNDMIDQMSDKEYERTQGHEHPDAAWSDWYYNCTAEEV